ncbi:uncharacterized protein MAL13P1.304-like [Mercenaria mercenaria]|uniref:uncharacterized protein MAL13P1.304-like n=1 Tax=Mercenaria mercenaria TaxID=6596 RepID=UPI00234E9015|nr:uncharacterized protein MAL13P1.304-like [Mercenaria mercenaria]
MRRSKRRKSSVTNTKSTARNRDEQELKGDHSSEPDKKRLKVVLRKTPYNEKDIKYLKEDKSCESDGRKLQTVEREVYAGSPDVRAYNEKQCNNSNTEKVKIVWRKGPYVRTDRKLQEQRSEKEKENLVVGKSSVESKNFEKYDEDQNFEPDNAKLKIVVRKDSETGEWTASEDQFRKVDNMSAIDRTHSESMKQTVCTLKETNSSSVPEEQKMFASKGQQCVYKNEKSVKRCNIDTKQKSSEITSDTGAQIVKQESGNKNFKKLKHNSDVMLSLHENDSSSGNFAKVSANLEQSSVDKSAGKTYDIESCNDESNNAKHEGEFGNENINLNKDMLKLKVAYEGDGEKPYVENETKLCLNEQINDAQNKILPKQMVKCKHNHDIDIITDEIEQNIVSDTNDIKSSNRFAKSSSKDVLIVEFFEDEDSVFSNDKENAGNNNNLDNLEAFDIDVDIKLFPYKSGCTNRKDIENEKQSFDDSSKDEVSENSHFPKSNDVHFSEMGVHKEDGNIGDYSLGIEYRAENQVHKPENVIHLEQNMVKPAEQVKISKQVENYRSFKQLMNKNPLFENITNGGVDLNESFKEADENVFKMNDSRCKTHLNQKQGDETFVNSTKNGEHISELEPNLAYTNMNERAFEEVSDVAKTNVNEFCWSQTCSAHSVNDVTENFKDIKDLISWTVNQCLSNDNISDDVASRPFENQDKEVVPEFNEKHLEHSDENNNCLIEVYVIDDNDMDVNNNNAEQMMNYDVSVDTEVKTQVGNVGYWTERGLFESDSHTDCYQTVNENDYRPICYDSRVYSEGNDGDVQEYFEASNSVMSEYSKQDVDLQMHEDLLEVDSSLNLSPVSDVMYEDVPYWDTCLVREFETKNYCIGKNKPQRQRNARGHRGRKSKRFIKKVNSAKIDDENLLKSEVKADKSEIKLAAKSKKGLTNHKYRNMKGRKRKGNRKNNDLCTRIEDDFIARKKLLRKLKNGKLGDRPHVVRVTEKGMIMDVTEEYHEYLPYQYGY